MAASPREKYQRERAKTVARAGDVIVSTDRYDHLESLAKKDDDASATALEDALDSLDVDLFDDVGTISRTDADAILEYMDARDEQVFTTNSDAVKTTDSGHSLRSYTSTLRTTAERLDGDLVDATPDEINQLMQDHLTGDHPAIKSGGLARNTVSSYQGILRSFARYHHGDDAAREVNVLPPEQNGADPEEMVYSDEEIAAMRDATDSYRNRALLEFLLGTGQRIRVVETLRIGDVDLENRRYDLPKDEDGLKNADRYGRRRGFYTAQTAMRDWLRNHPAKDDPDAYVFAHLPSWSRSDVGEQLSPQQIGRLLKGIAERAGLERDAVRAHKFRHTWVTIAKLDWGLTDSEIKRNLGHAKGSNVMATTYSWLDDEDVISSIESKIGIGEDDDADTGVLTPTICDVCSTPLQKGWVACPRCEEPLVPSVGEFDERADAATAETITDPDPDVSDDEAVLIELIRGLDPEAKAKAVEGLGN